MHLTCKSTFVSSAEGTRYELVQGGCFSPARGSRAGAVRWFSWMAGEFHTTDLLLALLTLQTLPSLRTTLKTDRFTLMWQLAVLTGFAFAGLQKAFLLTYPPCLDRPFSFRPALRHSICVAIPVDSRIQGLSGHSRSWSCNTLHLDTRGQPWQTGLILSQL